jgi:uroporphyrinogen decarboxylase
MNDSGLIPNSFEAVQMLVDRFDERVDEALVLAPPSKEWVGNALARRGGPRCPVHLRELSYDIILRHGNALADLFLEYPDDLVFVDPYEWAVGYQAPGATEPINALRVLTQEAEWTDEWGTRWGHTAGGIGATPILHPLEDWSQLDEYLAHQMPDPREPGRLAGASAKLKLHGPARYCAGNISVGLFERLHCLRGMENALEDFYAAPRETERLLNALTDYQVEVIRAWGRLANVDACLLTDDWGTQSALMISPMMWRRFFAAHYRRLCDEAHRSGLLVVFHSCGHITEIIGDLIDAGVDVIDPLQPEAMDLGEVAREFGGKVAFCGGISDQRLWSASPSQVRDEVRRMIDIFGAPHSNAYVIAPSNSLMPDTPLDNLEALFAACHDQ